MTREEADHILEVIHELLSLYKHNALDAKPEIKELVEACVEE